MVLDANWTAKLERPHEITAVPLNGSETQEVREVLEVLRMREEVRNFFEDTVVEIVVQPPTVSN